SPESVDTLGSSRIDRGEVFAQSVWRSWYPPRERLIALTLAVVKELSGADLLPAGGAGNLSHPSQPYRIHKFGNAARADETSTGQPVTAWLREERQCVPTISQVENGM